MPDLNDLPEAVAIPRRRRLPQLVWVIPIVAMIIGGWLVADNIAQRGPTVVISFLAAEGIEPGKTRIRYKDVDIGEVKNVAVAKDRSRVLVTAQLVKQAEKFLVSDTRFWVVRPRISGGKISGFGTLLSGAYIGVDIGKASEMSSEFVGLEVAPILTNGLPGRHFILRAANIGSLDIGSPVYFRRIQVGEVVAYELDKDGGNVTLKVFIQAPYDRHVTPRMRFWNASGVDVSLDANGVRLQSQSLVSILLGGVAFEAPAGDGAVDEAPADTSFVLYPDRALAMKAPDGEPLILTLYFEDSIRGLAPGAPLDFRGIVVGEVLSVGVEFEPKRDWFHFPVRAALYPERIGLRDSAKGKDSAEMIKQGLMKAMNERGFRAQLRTGNLLTGQNYIALDFFPDLKKLAIDWSRPPLELPTVRGSFEEIQVSLAKVLSKLGKMPLEEIGNDIRDVLKTLDRSVSSIDKLVQRVDGEMVPEVSAGIKDVRATLNSFDKLAQRIDGEMVPEVNAGIKDVRSTVKSFDKLAQRIDGEMLTEAGAGIKDMRATLRSFDKLAQRIDGEMVPEVNAGIKDMRSTLKSFDKLAQRVDVEMVPEVNSGIKDMRATLRSFDKLAQRVDAEMVPEVNAGIKDARTTLKSFDKLAQHIDGEMVQEAGAGIKDLRSTLKSFDKLAQRIDIEMVPEINAGIKDMRSALKSFDKLAQRVDGEMLSEAGAGIKDMRATFKSIDNLAQRINGEMVPEVNAGIKDARSTLKSFDKLAQRIDGEMVPDVNAGIKDARATLKSFDKLAQRIDGVMMPDVHAGIKEARATLKSIDKLAQHLDGEMAPEIHAGLKDARSMLKSFDKLAQRIDREMAPEIHAGLKDARATLKSIDKLAQRVDGEMLSEAGAGIKDMRSTLKSIDKLAQRVDGEIVSEAKAGIMDLRATLKNIDKLAQSIDKLAQHIDGEVAPEVKAGIKDLRASLVLVERLLSADSPLQQDIRDALREVGRAAQSFRFLSDTFERQPEALIRGKKEEK